MGGKQALLRQQREEQAKTCVGIYVSSAYPIACEMQANGVGVDSCPTHRIIVRDTVVSNE